MNSMVRYISIFLGAMTLSLASYSFASTETEADDGITFNDPTKDASNPCVDARGYKVADSDKCKNGVAVKKTPKKSSDSGSGNNNGNGNGNGNQQQQQQPAQQQQQQQPAQQASSGKSSGSCADTAEDPTGKQAQGSLLDKGQSTDQRGKGKKQACEAIKGSIEERMQKASQQGKQVGLTGDNYEELRKGYDEYIKNRESCLNGHASAATMCLENLSPDLAGGAAGVNSVLSQVGSNVSDTCGKANNAMDLAKGALSAFSGSCGAAKGMCNSACSKAKSGVEKLKAKAKVALGTTTCSDPSQSMACEPLKAQYVAALQEALQGAEQEQNSSDQIAIAGKLKLCNEKYAQLIGSAMQGVMSMLAGMMQSNKCEEESAGTTPEALGQIADKCILAENAALPECICAKNPRTVGCSNSFEKSDLSNSTQIATGATDGANVTPSTDLSSADMGSGLQHSPLSADGGSGGVGAPTGSNAGLGSSTVGSGSGAGGGDAGRKGLNTNILAGTGGGGGGAGGGWGGGSGDKYRAYLPGGAKDPARSVAGQQAWTKEVTGQGGKSNWEKVKDRYRDNKSTLLNN